MLNLLEESARGTRDTGDAKFTAHYILWAPSRVLFLLELVHRLACLSRGPNQTETEAETRGQDGHFRHAHH